MMVVVRWFKIIRRMDDSIGRKIFDTSLALVWGQHRNIWSKASCVREGWRNASPCSTVVERGDRRALVLATGDLRRWRNLIIARLDSHSLTCNSKWPALTTPCWVLGGNRSDGELEREEGREVRGGIAIWYFGWLVDHLILRSSIGLNPSYFERNQTTTLGERVLEG